MKYLIFHLFFLLFMLFFISACTSTADEKWQAEVVISDNVIHKKGIHNYFVVEEISDDLFNRMKVGNSWKEDTPDSLRSQLRYLKLLHRNLNGKSQTGEMVVNSIIADAVIHIFEELYQQDYPIERITLVDKYHADDEMAMRDNNTSCFNFRFKTNSTTDISKHGYGLAIDLNTLYNPYVKMLYINEEEHFKYGYEEKQKGIIYDIEPATGEPFAFNRSLRDDIPMKIDHDDLAYKLFTKAGFEWGGDWVTRKDYQHFEFTP